jgi:hypothetical protein
MYKVGIISEVYGTIPLTIPLGNSPFPGRIPPLFPIPFYLLGIPPWHVAQFPSTLVPGCLCTDLPPPFLSPHPPFPFPQRFLILNTCPPTTTSRHRLHIVRYTIIHKHTVVACLPCGADRGAPPFLRSIQ